MNIKDLVRFLYWDVMSFAVGVIIFYCVTNGIGSQDIFQSAIFYLAIAFLYIIVHTWLGSKIFKEKMTLTDKIMTCKLRMKHGLNYCADCPDGYKCPTDLK